MVGEKEKTMHGNGGRAKVRGIAFINDRLRGQAFDPGEWSGVWEAEIVGEEQDKVLVIGRGLEKSGTRLGLVAEVVVMGGVKVA